MSTQKQILQIHKSQRPARDLEACRHPPSLSPSFSSFNDSLVKLLATSFHCGLDIVSCRFDGLDLLILTLDKPKKHGEGLSDESS